MRQMLLGVVCLILLGPFIWVGCSRQEEPQAEPQKPHTGTHMEPSKQEAVAQTKDLVCGMTVSADSPHRTMHQGKTYYFCNAGCKERFLENPQQFMAH